MQFRQLGSSGVRVSTIGLGTNRFGTEVTTQDVVNNIIAACQDVGINFIDTADVYQDGRSEERLGVALKGRWDKFVLATKFTMKTGEVFHIRKSERYFPLVSLHTHDYFSTLRTKLNWTGTLKV